MMMLRSLLLLTLLKCMIAAEKEQLNCSEFENQSKSHNGGKFLETTGDKFQQFDWDISKELNAVEKGNIVISPISLKVVLAMLYEGATGKTAEEIGEVLDLANTTRTYTRDRFSSILRSLQTSKGEYEINIGSHVFIDKHAQPKEKYLCKLKMFYNSYMEIVDFSDPVTAAKQINNWASNVTEGHIQHLISDAEAHSSTIMLLLNAVYFKGLWKIPFPENQTELGTFHLNNKESTEIPMMNTTDKFFYINAPSLDAQMIKLPYLGDKFAMYVMVPNSKTGLDTLLNKLGPNRPLTNFIRDMYPTSVNLMMPKFEYDFTTSLRPTLEEIGIKTMFGSSAELSDIAKTQSGSLVVSNVLQKAGISVTETGTVAYAATVAELMDKFGGDDDTIQFKVDRPFLFFIEEEKEKTTVFLGKVTNPEKAQVKVTSSPPATEPSKCTGTKCSTSDVLDSDLNRVGAEDHDFTQERLNFFDAELLKEVAAKEVGNFVISPASIKSLLALVMEGADGSTLSKLLTTLRLPQNLTQAHQVLNKIQNVLWKKSTSKVTVDSHAHAFVSNRYQVNSSYSSALKSYYNADVTEQDFSSPNVAANNINSWINSRTRGLIPDLIDQGMISSESLAVLVSAIYFNGKWKSEFSLKDTKNKCFYSEPDMECQLIPTMFKEEDLYYKFDKALDSHILQIPYEDERFSMVIVLPKTRDGIKQLTVDAARLYLPDLLRDMRTYEVTFTMPRFTVEYGTELKDIMEEMNLGELFEGSAKLPYMINNQQGKVSAMVHKAKIEVSEKGTKAAAASGAGVVPLMYGLNSISLQVDHPFYYMVCDRDSQTVLFSGRFSSAMGEMGGLETLSSVRKPSTHGPQNQHNTPSMQTYHNRRDQKKMNS